MQPAIDLHGVEIDDFAMKAPGDGDGQLTFPGAGGAEDRDQGFELVRYNRSLELAACRLRGAYSVSRQGFPPGLLPAFAAKKEL